MNRNNCSRVYYLCQQHLCGDLHHLVNEGLGVVVHIAFFLMDARADVNLHLSEKQLSHPLLLEFQKQLFKFLIAADLLNVRCKLLPAKGNLPGRCHHAELSTAAHFHYEEQSKSIYEAMEWASMEM